MGPQDFSAINDWPGYFGAVLGKPPRDTLLAELAAFEREGVTGLAVDLATGEGRDALELLARGWRVLATDAEPAACDHLRPRVPAAAHDRLTTAVVRFEDTALPWSLASDECPLPGRISPGVDCGVMGSRTPEGRRSRRQR